MAEDVRIESRGLDKLIGLVRNDMAPGNPQRVMLRRWAARYATFTRKRFIQQSRGGEWPDLAPSTKRARARAKAAHGKRKKSGSRASVASRRFSILIDVGHLRDAILPKMTGNLLADGPGLVDIGFSGSTSAAAGVTFGDLATWHHYGRGNNPERTILVGPDQSTLRGMAADARAAGADIEHLIGKG